MSTKRNDIRKNMEEYGTYGEVRKRREKEKREKEQRKEIEEEKHAEEPKEMRGGKT